MRNLTFRVNALLPKYKTILDKSWKLKKLIMILNVSIISIIFTSLSFMTYERKLVDNFTKYILPIAENDVSWFRAWRKRNNKCIWKLDRVLIKWDR
jgi:hypothetical protein